MGLKRKLHWLVLVMTPLILLAGCGDLEPDMQDTRTVSLNMDFHGKSSSRSSSSVSATELSQYNTHLILALPSWEYLTIRYKNFYSSFAQVLMNTTDKKISLEIPLNTQMKIFAFLFKENYSMYELFSGNREVGYYGESQPFSIDAQTNNLSLGISLKQVPGTSNNTDEEDTNTGGGTDTVIDTTAPTMTFSLTDNTTGMGISDNITITFGEAVRNVDNTVLTNSNIDSHITLKLNSASGDNLTFDATIDANKKVITIDPTSDLFYSQTVCVAIGATLEDSADNLITAANAFFTTTMDPSLEAFYPFNGKANDESGNSYHGQLGDNFTTSKFPTLATDRFGNAEKAFSFDGNNDYINFGTEILSGDGEFSIVMWISTITLTRSHILQKRDTSINGEYIVEIKNNGKIRFWTYGGGYKWNVTSSSAVNDGNWHHLALVQKDNGGQMYLDGNLDQTDNSSGKVNLGLTLKTFMGGDLRDNNRYYSGKVDDLRIYSRALSASEIRNLYNN